MLEGAALDKYTFTRDIYLQRRESQIEDLKDKGIGLKNYEGCADSRMRFKLYPTVTSPLHKRNKPGELLHYSAVSFKEETQSHHPVSRYHKENHMMKLQRRQWMSSLLVAGAVLVSPMTFAAEEGPDALVQRISGQVMDAVKADAAIQAGDVSRIVALVDSKIMPNVNFSRMTSSAVGHFWRQATPEQQTKLQAEFKTVAGSHLCRRFGRSQRPDAVVQASPLPP